MKTAIKYLVIFAVIFNFTSCDKLDELTEVDFDTTISAPILINTVGVESKTSSTKIGNKINGEDEYFEGEVTISLDNSTTNKYLDLIEKIKIKKASFVFTNFSGDTFGEIKGDLYINNTKLLPQDSYINVSEAAAEATVFEVTNTQLISSIVSGLLANKKVTAKYAGYSNALDAMTFEIKVILDLTVTADAL